MSGKKRRSALQEAAGSGYDEEEAGRSADQGQTENDSRKDTGTEIRENRGSGGFAGRWREIRKRKGEGHMAGSTIGRGIRTAVRWVTDGGCLAGRLLWNGCWMIFSLTVFGFGLFFLYILADAGISSDRDPAGLYRAGNVCLFGGSAGNVFPDKKEKPGERGRGGDRTCVGYRK